MNNLTSLQALAVTIMLLFGASNCYATWVHCPVCNCDYKKGEDESQHGKNKWCDRMSIYREGYADGLKASKTINNKLLWEKGVNLNEVLCEHEELRLPIISGEQSNLAFSEFCPNCGAFTYWHRIQNKKRTCVRCYSVWERPDGEGGNYYAGH